MDIEMSANTQYKVTSSLQSAMSVLGVVLKDPDELSAIFGCSVIESALSELGKDLREVFSHVLAKRQTRQSHFSSGIWGIVFDCSEDVLQGQESEFREALTAAVIARVEESMLRIFGGGTGTRVDFAVLLFPLPSSQDFSRPRVEPTGTEDSLAEILREKLESLSSSDYRHVGIADPVRRSHLHSILEDRSVRTLLQPIVCLSNGKVVGYEALSRGPKDSELEFPDKLFGAARCIGEETRLELLCAELALLRTKNRIPKGQFLTLNLGPDALATAVNTLEFKGRTDVMVELTEHMPLDEIERLAPAVRQLRSMGVGFVLDDTGCGFADLDTAAALQPDIVKLCITITRQVQCTGTIFNAITDTVNSLTKLGCRILAEGVETVGQREALKHWPIELAQGWLYCKPAQIDEILGSTPQIK